MKGWGKAGGAISVVNAISVGKGATIGTDLYTEAYVELTEEPRFSLTINGQPANPILAKSVVEVFAKSLDVEVFGAKVSTTSNIPVAVGLKSSSSAAVAIAKAFLDAVQKMMPTEELLKLVAEASIISGTSITGALDDAAACMLGGAVVTHNLERKVLRRENLPPNLVAVILVPPGKTYTSEFRKEALEPVKPVVEAAFDLALKGDYWTAMTVNGLAHSAALGLSVEPSIAALKAGALGAGLSGTGPAVAAVADKAYAKKVAEAFASFDGKVIKCRIKSGSLDESHRG